ncbi:hypothetical protein G4Y79_20875 [Phototrophicus methaneseepsis]|uniref:Head-tail adaptor protein n=1 Tax=Phototrophicus methaneseepsis TaxID=2710758 RepID=A0A7S8IE12_9CHLR|nr:hypothetical protein [Phototrophicus methaneseepsis]QPC82111.1 hypothetical protein G4Y79_20875 [Phototrophicus methaneseepsis]
MLTDKELADIRRDMGEMLPVSCDILAVTYTQDSSGWDNTPSTNIRAAVPARLDHLEPDSSAQDMIATAESGRILYRLTVPWDADLRDSDQVRIHGVVYEVLAVTLEQTERFCRRALVSKLSDEAGD